MFEQLGNNFINMIQLQKINSTNIPRVASALGLSEECEHCSVPWEVRGNSITFNQIKRDERKISFPSRFFLALS